MRRLLIAIILPALLCAQEYVRVSTKDPRYLELSSGRPYVPIGLNLIAPPRAATPAESLKIFEQWLDALSANGGNYVRFWMSNPFWDTEHTKSGVYDESKAQLIEQALAMCVRRGIKAKLDPRALPFHRRRAPGLGGQAPAPSRQRRHGCLHRRLLRRGAVPRPVPPEARLAQAALWRPAGGLWLGILERDQRGPRRRLPRLDPGHAPGPA